MNKNILTVVALSLLAVFGTSFDALAGGGHDHGGHEEEAEHDEPAKGPNGGRLLVTDDFALEVTIFEKGVPPQFRLFAYNKEKPVSPEKVTASIELHRLGADDQVFKFSPQEKFLATSDVVEEPHSFDVHVTASFEGKNYSWEYDSYEGRTELTDEAIKQTEIKIEPATAQTLQQTVEVYGQLIPNEDKVAHIAARFPGVLKEIKKKLGDSVQKGEVLAVVESNQNLVGYEIKSQISGVIIERHATLGEFVPEAREIFVVADLSDIWADFQIYRDDFGRAAIGQDIVVHIGDEDKKVASKVTYVSPVTDQATQSKRIRTSIPNPDLTLRPGLFVTGNLTVSTKSVPLAVKRTALQTFRDWDVVFINEGDVFQAMPVELGAKDAQFVEVLSGIKNGQKYVSDNSFIIKADIEKSGASHDH